MHTEQQNIKRSILVLFIAVFKQNRQFQNPYDQWQMENCCYSYHYYDCCSSITVIFVLQTKKASSKERPQKPSLSNLPITSTPHLISESRHAFRNAGRRDVAKILGETKKVAGWNRNALGSNAGSSWDHGEKVKVIWKGSHNPILRANKGTTTIIPGMILQVYVSFWWGLNIPFVVSISKNFRTKKQAIHLPQQNQPTNQKTYSIRNPSIS